MNANLQKSIYEINLSFIKTLVTKNKIFKFAV